MALVMLYNVWMVIWPNQQIVIANARNVQAGGEADPTAAGVGPRRRDGVAAEHDLLVPGARSSWSASAHFYGDRATSRRPRVGAKWSCILLIGIVVIACSRRTRSARSAAGATPGLNVIYETHKNAMYTGIGLIVGFYILAEILLRA